MPDRTVSWAAWGWIALLGAMVLVPLLGIVLDRAASLVAIAVPMLAGTVLGCAITLSALYLRHRPWWGPAALAGLTVVLVLFHRQIGLLLIGALAGVIVALLREPLWRNGSRVLRWLATWRRRNSA